MAGERIAVIDDESEVLETMQAIRQIHPSIVGATMTGYGTMETAIEALRQGMERHLAPQPHTDSS